MKFVVFLPVAIGTLSCSRRSQTLQQVLYRLGPTPEFLAVAGNPGMVKLCWQVVKLPLKEFHHECPFRFGQLGLVVHDMPPEEKGQCCGQDRRRGEMSDKAEVPSSFRSELQLSVGFCPVATGRPKPA